jgi:hypothetical protein
VIVVDVIEAHQRGEKAWIPIAAPLYFIQQSIRLKRAVRQLVKPLAKRIRRAGRQYRQHFSPLVDRSVRALQRDKRGGEVEHPVLFEKDDGVLPVFAIGELLADRDRPTARAAPPFNIQVDHSKNQQQTLVARKHRPQFAEPRQTQLNLVDFQKELNPFEITQPRNTVNTRRLQQAKSPISTDTAP